MGRTISTDLRSRVIDAIEGGMSRRGAAAHFDVSYSSAIRWFAEFQASGRRAARPRGGDRRSERIEAHAAFILGLVEETPDISLEEIQQALGERGARFGIATVSRFFKRRRITYKKRRRMLASKIAQM